MMVKMMMMITTVIIIIIKIEIIIIIIKIFLKTSFMAKLKNEFKSADAYIYGNICKKDSISTSTHYLGNFSL